MVSSWKPISELVEDVKNGVSSATGLVEKSLTQIEEKNSYKAIIAPVSGRARQRAAEIDEKIKNGENVGRLAGVPFIAKDNFLAFGADTTAASNILKGFEAPYQSTAIEKLEAEGAICVAKANLDAFGHGGSTENSDFMTTLNPHDTSRVPGGSSGGSAAAVVLGMAPFALGTDTGGSNRQPAAFSGCIGYKPTYGLISRSGVIAMASSTDTIGALTNSVDDLGLVIDVMAGKDIHDATTISRDADDYSSLEGDLKGKKFGLIKEWMAEGIDEEVRRVINECVSVLQKQGVTVEEVSLPSIRLSLPAYYILVPAEISSNLSRYDGQRYGYSASSNDLEESYLSSRSIGFGDEAKRRIMIGTYVLSSGYYDAYYQQAQIIRTKIIEEFKELFKNYDALIGPTAPTVAFRVGENTKDPLKMYLADAMTVGASLAGMPAISIPAASGKELPVGLQIICDQTKDKDLLTIAKKIQELIKS